MSPADGSGDGDGSAVGPGCDVLVDGQGSGDGDAVSGEGDGSAALLGVGVVHGSADVQPLLGHQDAVVAVGLGCHGDLDSLDVGQGDRGRSGGGSAAGLEVAGLGGDGDAGVSVHVNDGVDPELDVSGGGSAAGDGQLDAVVQDELSGGDGHVDLAADGEGGVGVDRAVDGDGPVVLSPLGGVAGDGEVVVHIIGIDHDPLVAEAEAVDVGQGDRSGLVAGLARVERELDGSVGGSDDTGVVDGSVGSDDDATLGPGVDDGSVGGDVQGSLDGEGVSAQIQCGSAVDGDGLSCRNREIAGEEGVSAQGEVGGDGVHVGGQSESLGDGVALDGSGTRCRSVRCW